MSNIDIQVVLSTRFRTSAEADKVTIELSPLLGLETKAQFARLAIGRSLAMGKINDEMIDSKGIEVPAQALFSTDNIGAWIGLIVAHSKLNNGILVDSQDTLRAAIRCHWHRGALELFRDWNEVEQDYDKFVEVLIARRSEMPENVLTVGGDTGAAVLSPGGKEKAKDESSLLIKGLDALNIKVQIKETIVGPRVTRYRVLLMNLADSNRLNRNLSQLALAMNLGDKTPTVSNGDEPMTVFVDVPRSKDTWSSVSIDNLTNWINKTEYNEGKLNCYIGVSVTGEDVTFDLASAPHLLVGGTTNSGKSVCLHSIILSLLMKHGSENLQLALIDPKRVEFSSYAKLKNLYQGSIATEVPEAKELLTTLVAEMDSRYAIFESINASNIAEARAKGKKLSFIVVFIEEMADLVLQDKNIEPLIVRLAQKARAAGIHLVLATQRPDSETFSGLIRSNIPARIALTVQKGSESSIILDERGAENLLGSGDMLLKVSGETIKRAHGVYASKENISQILLKLQK